MKSLIKEDFDTNLMLDAIVSQPSLHAAWLNTLSYLENSGAHLIFANQNKLTAKLSELQHAAEEARHAFFFKNQIAKIMPTSDFTPKYLGWRKCKRLLLELDLFHARLLKENNICVRYNCYLLTTYHIELLAKDLYSDYQRALTKHESKVSLTSLLKEEMSHLRFMEKELQNRKELQEIGRHSEFKAKALKNNWLKSVSSEISALL